MVGFDVLQQQVNLIRRFLSNAQTPDSAITLNIGDIFTMGPEEAAWAVNELIRPKAAIMTHANQESTKGGKVVPGSKTETFIKAVRSIPVHVPLSGRTMEFDGNAQCMKGCN